MPTTTTTAQLRFATVAHRDGDDPGASYHLLLALIDTLDDLGNMLAKINASIAHLGRTLAPVRPLDPPVNPADRERCEQDSM